MVKKLLQAAQRLTIYIGESDRWRGKPLYAAILETLKVEKMAGATVLRGVAGFGAHSNIHTAAVLRLSEDLPLVIQVIDAPEKIQRVIELVSPMVSEGLITLEDVQVLRYTHRHLNPLPVEKMVSEVMTREVVTLSADDSVAQAWLKMLDTLIKAMPVVDAQGRVIGMLTDEDLLERAGAQQRLAVAQRFGADILQEELARLRQSALTVADVMTRPVITTQATDSLGVAAARMAKAGIKRLPVVDENGKLLGILSRVDILRLAAHKEARKVTAPLGAAKNLRQVMTASIPSVRFDDDLAEVVEALLEGGSHRVIVLNEADKAVGLISDADVVGRLQPVEQRGALAALMRKTPAPASDVTAEKIMSPGLLTASPETSVVDAVRMVLAAKRKWLVVVDENEHPLGLVDRHLLLRALTAG